MTPALSLAPPAATADVGISNLAFTPPVVTIIAGDELVWRNLGSQQHRVASQPQGPL